MFQKWRWIEDNSKSKNWDSSLLAEPSSKKYWRKFFRQKAWNPRQKFKSTWKKETTSKDNYVIIEDSINAYSSISFLSTYLKSNCVCMCRYICVCIDISAYTHTAVIHVLLYCWAYNIQKCNIFSINSLKKVGETKAVLG